MSSHNKPFSYGQPSIEALLDCFFSGNNDPLEFLTNNEAFDTIKHEIKRLQDQFEEEVKIAKEIKHRNKTNDHDWWEQQRVDDMGLDEVERFVKYLEQLRSNVVATVNKEEPKANNNDLAIIDKSDGNHHEARVVDPLTDHKFVNDIAPLNFFFDDGNFFDNMDISGLI
ncbi:agamous-like MADS-box protein AGL61 [Pistacia vera]|uniref:agamous-like MADS-box protein AGL61 n=1 Tax=Pistacia vera TaxID=55513 RepID=UPI0012637197|nr:agamous-like MADS-box protein AGL61 [Pistacia vera]